MEIQWQASSIRLGRELFCRLQWSSWGPGINRINRWSSCVSFVPDDDLDQGISVINVLIDVFVVICVVAVRSVKRLLIWWRRRWWGGRRRWRHRWTGCGITEQESSSTDQSHVTQNTYQKERGARNNDTPVSSAQFWTVITGCQKNCDRIVHMKQWLKFLITSLRLRAPSLSCQKSKEHSANWQEALITDHKDSYKRE